MLPDFFHDYKLTRLDGVQAEKFLKFISEFEIENVINGKKVNLPEGIFQPFMDELKNSLTADNLSWDKLVGILEPENKGINIPPPVLLPRENDPYTMMALRTADSASLHIAYQRRQEILGHAFQLIGKAKYNIAQTFQVHLTEQLGLEKEAIAHYFFKSLSYTFSPGFNSQIADPDNKNSLEECLKNSLIFYNLAKKADAGYEQNNLITGSEALRFRALFILAFKNQQTIPFFDACTKIFEDNFNIGFERVEIISNLPGNRKRIGKVIADTTKKPELTEQDIKDALNLFHRVYLKDDKELASTLPFNSAKIKAIIKDSVREHPLDEQDMDAVLDLVQKPETITNIVPRTFVDRIEKHFLNSLSFAEQTPFRKIFDDAMKSANNKLKQEVAGDNSKHIIEFPPFMQKSLANQKAA